MSRADLSLSEPRELRIELWIDEWVEFEGTAAQLEAEGLIPKAFEWPSGAADKNWEVNGFRYWLRRSRPAGFKGPRRAWLQLDNWFVRVTVCGRNYVWSQHQRIQRLADQLRAELYRQSAAGRREWDANYSRQYQARTDRRFQAFKALIPGLVPAKRGRKPRAQSPEPSIGLACGVPLLDVVGPRDAQGAAT